MARKGLQSVWLVVFTAALVLSPWLQHVHGQDNHYCIVKLNQTKTAALDCDKSAQTVRISLGNPTSLRLLCCLGALSVDSVTTKWADNLENSLLFYVSLYVDSPSVEQDVAEFVSQCADLDNLLPKLTEDDYKIWNSSSGAQCRTQLM